MATLRSELFGISDAALYAFKRSNGQFSFRAHVPKRGLSPEDGAAIQDAFDRLSRYYGWVYLLPPAASVEKIVADLGLFARAIASPGGDVRAGSLAKVIELVRSAATEQFSLIDLPRVSQRSGGIGPKARRYFRAPAQCPGRSRHELAQGQGP